MLSPSDTAIVFLLALLLFGPEQLPKIARQLGEAMRHIQSTTHTFMNEMERAASVPDDSGSAPGYELPRYEPPRVEPEDTPGGAERVPPPPVGPD